VNVERDLLVVKIRSEAPIRIRLQMRRAGWYEESALSAMRLLAMEYADGMGIEPFTPRPSPTGWALSSVLSVSVHIAALFLLGATAALPVIPGPKGGSINVRLLGAPGPGGPPASAPQGPPQVVAAPEPIPVPPVAAPKPEAPKVKARVEKKKPAPARPAIARERPKKERPPLATAEELQPRPEAQPAAQGAPPAGVASAVSGSGGPGGGGGSPGTGGGLGGGHGSGSGQVARQDSRWATRLLEELRRQLEARKRYPRAARVRREEGTVVLRVRLSSSGMVSNWEIAEASPFPALDDAALEAARSIQTLRANGSESGPAEVSVVVPMRFSLSSVR
jgi:protein TonB